jgi:hypothetical protein
VLQEEENKIKVAALRTTNNINTIIKVMVHSLDLNQIITLIGGCIPRGVLHLDPIQNSNPTWFILFKTIALKMLKKTCLIQDKKPNKTIPYHSTKYGYTKLVCL